MSAPDGEWVVLDLGCGTGLAGAAIAGRCRHLVGVDLSANMLAEARARGVYDRLEHADLVSMARGEAAGTYDLILAADVFIYVGDLVDVMREAHRILRPGGLFALSAEAAESVPDATAPQQLDAGYRLQGSGRYAHSAAYLRAVAAQVDFELAELSGIEVRLENEQPVQGWLALLRR
jgi:predicted TPR repeat methyltransferase